MCGGTELGLVLLVIVLLFVVPRVRQQAVELVDERELGSRELARLRESGAVDPCDNAAVAMILARFQERLDLRTPSLRAVVVDQDALNAAALPDGTVVLWRGLVEAVEAGLVPTDELAGLLAHELAHIELGHGRQRAIQELLARPLLGRLAATAGGPAARVAVGKGMDLLRKGASREAELEADRVAVGLLRGAGFEPEGLERFLGRLERTGPEQPEWTALLSTHPHLRERRARLREA